MTAVLEIRGLSKSFDGIVVASDVELTLEAGRIVGLIGPNGAGKTSLFNLVSGVVEPDAGTVTLAGMPLDGLKLHERIRYGLSRTWQHTRLFPSLSVIDNLLAGTHDYPGERLFTILFSRSQIKSHDGAAREKANDILGRMGLAHVANGLVSDLPYGQQKGQSYAAMRRVVREVADRGVAVCVVEHNVAFVRDLCDEGVFMFAGKLMARGTVAELIADPHLTELYFGT